MNNFKNILKKLEKRFATKVFDSSFKIEPDLEKKIEGIFNLAPTSFGLQPFKLIKVSSNKDREMIKKISWNQKQIIDCSLLYVLSIETDITEVLERYEKLLINARKVDYKEAHEYSNFVRNFLAQRSLDGDLYKSWAVRQMYLALGFFLGIAAISGIDTAPLEGYEQETLDDYLSLSKYNLSSRVILCIGKRSILDKYPKLAKIRKSRSDLMFHL